MKDTSRAERLPMLEEILAERKRQQYVATVFSGAIENLQEETDLKDSAFEIWRERKKLAISRLERMLNEERKKGDRDAAVIGELLKKYEILFGKAYFDELTGLHNRAGFNELLKAYHEKGVRSGVILSLDLDRFKSINDGHDHLVGDDVLRTVSRLLAGNFRSTDPITRIEREKQDKGDTPTVSRMGGEEILIFLPGANLEQAKKALRNIQIKLNKQLEARGLKLIPTETETDENGEFLSLQIPYDGFDQEKEKARVKDFEIPEDRKNMITISGSAFEWEFPETVSDWTEEVNKIVKKGESPLQAAKKNGRNRIYV